MIEDNAQYALDLARNGVATILLEMPRNRDIDISKYPNIYRVKDRQEIIAMITE